MSRHQGFGFVVGFWFCFGLVWVFLLVFGWFGVLFCFKDKRTVKVKLWKKMEQKSTLFLLQPAVKMKKSSLKKHIYTIKSI